MEINNALNKLNDRQIEYCKIQSCLISGWRKRGVKNQVERISGMLVGFLDCLEQLQIITSDDSECLFLWFSGEDRLNKE